MNPQDRSPIEVGDYTVKRNKHTSTADATNHRKYHYGLADDGTWIHWSSSMFTGGSAQKIRHESVKKVDVEAVDISADTVRESILRMLPDEDETPDENKPTYEYLRNNAQDVAADLVTFWQGMAEANMSAVGLERLGVGQDVLFTTLQEPWQREARRVMEDHGIAETKPKNGIEPTIDILEYALRDAVKEVTRWYYPHAEYIVEFNE